MKENSRGLCSHHRADRRHRRHLPPRVAATGSTRRLNSPHPPAPAKRTRGVRVHGGAVRVQAYLYPQQRIDSLRRLLADKEGEPNHIVEIMERQDETYFALELFDIAKRRISKKLYFR